ncbi:MAG: FAD-dependent oxidoreductase, partial [Anaerolineales bacterium]|nr:FAD-dependent oxidoreductase [Anaerolineales bacterium]
PNMKLDKQLVQRRIDVMAAAGITFLTNQEVGRDVSAEALQAEYDAIVLCTGATRPRDMAAPGREAAGIHFAVDYLHGNTKALLDSDQYSVGSSQFISAAGKDVIVIGGGDTGTDCVASALRQGCRSLTQFEILPQPPLSRPANNPWPQWPRTLKTDYGQEEAAALFGTDPRQFCVMTKRFVADEAGQLTAVQTVQVEWASNGDGRPHLHEIPGTEKMWPAQLVLLAMGFLGPENPLLAQLGVAQDGQNVGAGYGRFQTNIPHIFAAGDARRGQSLVVWAINEGRGAAREVDRWLMGKTDLS